MLKKSLSSLAVRRFIVEAKDLEGAYFQKAYQIDFDTIVLRFAVRKEQIGSKESELVNDLLDENEGTEEKEGISLGEGGGNYVRFDLYFKMGGFLFISPQVEREMPRQPSPFAMKLRKSLSNRILKSIDQVGMDRLVVLTFNPHKDDQDDWKLYLELFGDGNAILVKGDRIEAPFTSRTWATRTIKKGEIFSPPPSGIDTFKLTRDVLDELISNSSEDLIRFLIKRVNLPPPYAEEVCIRCGLEKKMALDAIDEDTKGLLFLKIWELLDEVRSGEGAFVHFIKGEAILIEPVLLAGVLGSNDIKEAERKFSEGASGGKGDFFMKMGSISQAIEVHMFEEEDPGTTKRISRKERKLDKLKAMLSSQRTALDKRKKEMEDSKIRADSLYMDYQRIDDLLKGFNMDQYRNEPGSFPNVTDARTGPGGSITIDVEIETDKGRMKVSLDPDLDINQNADLLYSRSKTARRKIEGIEKALVQTRKKIEEAKGAREKEEEAKGNARSLRRFWFEAYRWCFTSDRILLVAGRDAKTNERVVKKYLRESDIYAHADLSGAASVVARIDDEKEDLQATKVQACHFSLLNSKAWNAKIGSAGGYWVYPDQVSRSPQPGEFVAKGSFIIRGKKNLVDKLPLVGAVGTMYIEGVPKVMFGPEEAVKEVCSGTYYKVIPGRTKKTDIAKMISKELGGELDQVMSVLPPGDMDISRITR